MRRTTIAGLVAGLTLVAAPVPAGAAPSAITAATASSTAGTDGTAGIPARGKLGWTTAHKRAGAKIQVCQHRVGSNWGLEMRLDARKAKHWVRGRVRIQYLVQGMWNTFPGSSSPWRRNGVVHLTNFLSGGKTSVLIQARIRKRSDKPPFTGWIDVSDVKRCR
ncbi:hypothetical protein KVF89_28200 [Nocardioides carbamazepini]|uniref:hypothetical protein n=1 Tax=Nocardioides carbamazepini TaxID=2854259 RepID=UPI00214A58FD|nr:hypothetical protein [Nocardioides carbamazepini]MCR1786449.1 hypothetical protein [Nocardioides carbamazepini]